MIVRKGEPEITKMRAAGGVVAEVLAAVESAIVPGVTTTADLDRIAETLCRQRGAVPAFKNYNGFPANTCISVNETVIHGIPGSRILQSGDIVSIDFACSLNGFFADAAVTLPVGAISPEAQRLLAITRECLYKGIAQARVGMRLGDVASAIQQYAEQSGYSIVREYVGHGVGKALHEDPDVPNYGRAGQGLRLLEGMTLAIEPMVNQGGRAVKTLKDKWTVVTADNKLSAHFEHTVVVTRSGAEILTLPLPQEKPDSQSALVNEPTQSRERAVAAVVL